MAAALRLVTFSSFRLMHDSNCILYRSAPCFLFSKLKNQSVAAKGPCEWLIEKLNNWEVVNYVWGDHDLSLAVPATGGWELNTQLSWRYHNAAIYQRLFLHVILYSLQKKSFPLLFTYIHAIAYFAWFCPRPWRDNSSVFSWVSR